MPSPAAVATLLDDPANLPAMRKQGLSLVDGKGAMRLAAELNNDSQLTMAISFPYARPDVTQADIESVIDSMRGQFLTQGPKLALFEAALAEKLGAKHAVVCNSGTAALHLAYLALELGPKRGLLTSPITFLSTANAARMCGAPVAFTDVDPQTGNVTPETAHVALDRTRVPVAALTAVHLGGRACDMAGLRELTAERGIALIEDASHAPLAKYRDERGQHYSVGACAHSDVAAFSFHAIKHLAMGEGGALLTNDDRIADRARLFRSHGMTRDAAHGRRRRSRTRRGTMKCTRSAGTTAPRRCNARWA